MLLVQSKQKTRARAFEHLIRLALALRNLDNLDSLSTRLSGIYAYTLLMAPYSGSISWAQLYAGPPAA